MANGDDEATQAGQELARLQAGLEPDYYGRYRRNQPGSQYYNPRGSGAYYGMGQKRMRDKDIAIAGGIGILGAGIERFLKSKEADTSGVQYAEQEFAKAQAELEAPTPKVTEEEKAAMVQAATAPVRTEIEEIKSDTGSYLASTGRTANVADVVAARDVGTQALADAPLHAEALATQKDLELMKFDQAKKAAAKARSDNMAQVLDQVEVKQLKYDQAFVGDLTKVALTSAAHAVAQDDRPAMERLREKGASMAEITTLHKQAIQHWPWGSREYEIYMMSHYEGRGGATDKQTKGQKKGESATVTAQPLPAPGRPVSGPEDASARLRKASIEPGDPEASIADSKIKQLARELAKVTTTVTSQSPGRYYKTPKQGVKLYHSNMDDLSRFLEQHGYNPTGGDFDYYAHPQGRDSKGNAVTKYYAVSKGDPKPTKESTKVGSTMPILPDQ